MVELTKSQKEIQTAARDFAKGEFDRELAYELEKSAEFPVDIWKKAAELGFIGIHFPEQYSGGGLGFFEQVLITEAFCRKDSSIGGALMLAGHASECIAEFGSADLKNDFLPTVLSGKSLSGGAFTEGTHGVSLSDIKTIAMKDGEDWVINGTKSYVLNAGKSGFYIVLCQTDSETASPETSMSLILVEEDRPGLTIGGPLDKLGGKMTAVGELKFNDVRVPCSHLVGKEGHGISQLASYNNKLHIMIAAQALGIAAGSFDRAVDYVKNRQMFGKKLGDFQVSRHKIADMATKIELARLITYQAALNRDKGDIRSPLPVMAKMTATKAAMEISAQTIQLLGGYGFMTEYEVERFYRDAKAAELLTGAKDIQKDIISDAILGKN